MKIILKITFSLLILSGLIYFFWGKYLSYPNFKINHAILYTLDGSLNRSNIANDSSELLLRTDNGTDGASFINNKGVPIHTHYRTRELSDKNLEDVNSCINQINLSEVMTTECIPVYRDVIVYYSQSNEPIAWLSLCFECRKMYLKTHRTNSNFRSEFKIIECLESKLVQK